MNADSCLSPDQVSIAETTDKRVERAKYLYRLHQKFLRVLIVLFQVETRFFLRGFPGSRTSWQYTSKLFALGLQSPLEETLGCRKAGSLESTAGSWGCLGIGAWTCPGMETPPRDLAVTKSLMGRNTWSPRRFLLVPPHTREKAKLLRVRQEARSPSLALSPAPSLRLSWHQTRVWLPGIIQKQGGLLSGAPEDLVRSQLGGLRFSGPLVSWKLQAIVGCP